MRILENWMYQVTDIFLAPVLIVICLLFIYSLYQLGRFFMQWLQRHRHRAALTIEKPAVDESRCRVHMPGYYLLQQWQSNPGISQDELDVLALKELEPLRVVTRLSPMLGLIATMIPMGAALKSLAQGNVQGISENLVVAFSAVIFGLVIASLTFWMASVKKRWLVTELVVLKPLLTENTGHKNKEVLHAAA